MLARLLESIMIRGWTFRQRLCSAERKPSFLRVLIQLCPVSKNGCFDCLLSVVPGFRVPSFPVVCRVRYARICPVTGRGIMAENALGAALPQHSFQVMGASFSVLHGSLVYIAEGRCFVFRRDGFRAERGGPHRPKYSAWVQPSRSRSPSNLSRSCRNDVTSF